MIIVNGIRPTSTIGHKRNGHCGVCGNEGRLSWTHIPPRYAGNTGPASPLVTVPDGHCELMSTGREKDGGAAAYLLCEKCNNEAGNWYDPGFGALWHHLANLFLRENKMPPFGGPYPMRITSVDPGAVVRAVLSGMMAQNPELRTRYPGLQRAVTQKSTVAAPEGLHLLVGLTNDLHLRVAGGTAIRQVVCRGRVLREVVTFNEWAWAPFYIVLTDKTGRDYWRSAWDMLCWLADDPGERRDVDLLLPVLRPEDFHTREMQGGAVVGRGNGMVAVHAPFGQDLRPTG
jgi:hypothetical protein